ncbi:MAG: hypothetical protein U1F14_14550 [Steroidobacteraceae bacterium]
MFLPKSVYEALPWLYGIAGIASLAVSYRLGSAVLSTLLALFGVFTVVAGLVVALRRRDFREQKSHYGNPFDEE